MPQKKHKALLIEITCRDYNKHFIYPKLISKYMGVTIAYRHQRFDINLSYNMTVTSIDVIV